MLRVVSFHSDVLRISLLILKKTVKCLNFKWSWLWECFTYCLNANNKIRKTKVRISCTRIYFSKIFRRKTHFLRHTNKKGAVEWFIIYPHCYTCLTNPIDFKQMHFLFSKKKKMSEFICRIRFVKLLHITIKWKQ